MSTVIFASPTKTLSLDSSSFSDCKGIVCVIVDQKLKKTAKVAFDEKVINGDMCPYVPGSHKNNTALIVGCVVGGVALIVIIIVVIVVRKKKEKADGGSIYKPIFTTIDN